MLTIKSFVDLYLRAAFLCITHHTSTYGRMVDGHIYFIYNRVIMAIISLLFFISVTAAVSIEWPCCVHEPLAGPL